MDKKDQIILQQLDVIRTMTENGIRRMNSDFWGAPAAPAAPAAPKAEEKQTKTATGSPAGDAEYNSHSARVTA